MGKERSQSQGNIPKTRNHVLTEYILFGLIYFECFVDFAERVKRCGTRSSLKVHQRMIQLTRLPIRGTLTFYLPCTIDIFS